MQYLIEQLLEDLNSYCECQISISRYPLSFISATSLYNLPTVRGFNSHPFFYKTFVDDSNTINIKLFPTYPNPPPVHDYQVPVYTVELKQLMDVNWDITMQKVRSFFIFMIRLEIVLIKVTNRCIFLKVITVKFRS